MSSRRRSASIFCRALSPALTTSISSQQCYDTQTTDATLYSVFDLSKKQWGSLWLRARGRVIEEGQQQGLGEHCKLSLWGLGQSSRCPELLVHFIAQQTYVKCQQTAVWHVTSILPKPIPHTNIFGHQYGGCH